jgi:hypothetical protein
MDSQTNIGEMIMKINELLSHFQIESDLDICICKDSLHCLFSISRWDFNNYGYFVEFTDEKNHRKLHKYEKIYGYTIRNDIVNELLKNAEIVDWKFIVSQTQKYELWLIVDQQLTKYQLAQIRKAMNHANKENAKNRKKLNYGKNN